MPSIGIIRVLSTSNEDLLNSHARLLQEFLQDPKLTVVSRCIDGHPKGLWSEEELRVGSPKVVRLGQQMVEEDGVAALVVSCAADPGVPELQKTVSIPVIGAGSAAAAMARTLGRPVGALGITPWVLPPIGEMLGPRLVAWETPEGVRATTDLMSQEGKEGFIQAGERLRQKGAEVILLACTGFSTIRLAPFLREHFGLPVIDPVLSAGILAWSLVRGKQWHASR